MLVIFFRTNDLIILYEIVIRKLVCDYYVFDIIGKRILFIIYLRDVFLIYFFRI